MSALRSTTTSATDDDENIKGHKTAAATSKTSVTIHVSSTLDWLSNDILKFILMNYCDGCTLKQFWHAVEENNATGSGGGGHRRRRSSRQPLLPQQKQPNRKGDEGDEQIDIRTALDYQVIVHAAVRYRRCRISNSETFGIASAIFGACEAEEDDEDNGAVKYPRRLQLFHNLFAIDYCEQIPMNLIWCGKLQFKDPSALRPFHSSSALLDDEVQVMLTSSPLQWNTDHLSTWCSIMDGLDNHSSVASHDRHEITLQNYNFVPIHPRARIVGFTSADRQTLRRISLRMERDNLVGTLAARSRRHHDGGDFILRIVSFSQAEERLERLFNGSSRVKTLKHEKMRMVPMTSRTTDGSMMDVDDRNSLLCCWEHESSWDNNQTRTRADIALQRNYRRYKEQITNPNEQHNYHGW
jgi:hypothetical protein